jgi:hypothetical protein
MTYEMERFLEEEVVAYLRCYLAICMERPRKKPIENISQESKFPARDSNSPPPEYKSGPIPLDQWYSIFFVSVTPDIISLQLCTPKAVGV